MDFFADFISEYGLQIAYTLLTAVAAWIGGIVARYYKKWVNTREKKELAKVAVTAVEQIYKSLHGEEKFDKAYEALAEMLAEHDIHITDLEIRMLIEAAVGEANKAFERVIAAETEEIEEAAEEQDPAQVSLEEVL